MTSRNIGRVSVILVSALFCAALLSGCTEQSAPEAVSAKPVFPGAAPLAHRHRNHSLTESPDKQLRVYAAQRGDVTDLMLSRRTDGEGWSKPVVLNLPKRETNTSPRFFPDGTLYYSSDAPHPDRPGRKDLNIWRVTHVDGVFGTPTVLPNSINTGSHEDTFAPLGAGRAVFSSTTLGGEGGFDLYVVEENDGDWDVTPFPHNTAMADSHPVATKDGATLIWYGHLPSDKVYGAVDLFFSRLENGTWSEPKNLGPAINTAGIEYGAGLSVDDEALFFSRDGVLLEIKLEAALGQAGYVTTE